MKTYKLKIYTSEWEYIPTRLCYTYYVNGFEVWTRFIYL
jgi:hypothetical protein